MSVKTRFAKHSLAVPALFLCLSGSIHANIPPVSKDLQSHCPMNVSELSLNDKPMTYEDLVRRKDVTLVASNGTVVTGPIKIADGREAVFKVSPDGCMTKQWNPYH